MDVFNRLNEILRENKTYEKDELKLIVKNIIEDLQIKNLQRTLFEKIKKRETTKNT